MKSTRLLALAPLLFACRSSDVLPDVGDGVEAISLLGEELPRPTFEPEREAELRQALDAAIAAREACDDEDAVIWHGRRLAYLGRYRDAVDVYTAGLQRFPESIRLRRHRGHRFVSLRLLDRAIEDLAEASRRIEGVPDEVEPDGAPNELGIPRSTNHSNVEYHLGLALFLNGDFEAALAAYRRCRVWSRVNDDMLVATTHWLFMTLRRLGRADEARAVLEPIHADMEILENHAYHRALRFARGDLERAEVLAGWTPDDIEYASAGFGLAHELFVRGDVGSAVALWEAIVAHAPPMAFGRIASEAELARRGSGRVSSGRTSARRR